jgi:S-adenosylmethionine synthetase
MQRLITAESVTEGHPDKIADQISDAVVDTILAQDPDARVACDVLISNGFCIVGGEIHTEAYAPISEIARNTIREIGYTDGSFGFDYRSAGVLLAVGEQSSDIAQGVAHKDGVIGAGDQGTVYGYACDETPQMMPRAIMLAHQLTRRLAQVRKEGILPYLCPDGKAQVVLAYENDRFLGVRHVTLSSHHTRTVSTERLREGIEAEVIDAVITQKLRAENFSCAINPTGLFVIGGPQADTGLTGRKNIVDSYGGACPHGGGAYSGKDGTKVDRSGAYMARYIAKNLVAAKVCPQVTVAISYVIGIDEPVALDIDTHGTHSVPLERIHQVVRENFPLDPAGMIATLDLKRPQYYKTASYGHFGREKEGFVWERTDKAEAIRAALN